MTGAITSNSIMPVADENVPPRRYGSNFQSNSTMLERIHELLLSDKPSTYSKLRVRYIELDRFGNSMCLESISRPFSQIYQDIVAIDKVK